MPRRTTLLVSLLLSASLAGGGAAAAAPRPAPPPGVTLPVLTPALRAALPASHALPASARVRLGFALAPAHPAALAAYARAVADPASPLYRRFLTRAQVDARFGPPAGRVGADVAYLRGAGYERVQVSGWVVYASATPAVVARTLGAGLRAASLFGGTWLTPTRDPVLPAGLTGVAWVSGLTAALSAPHQPLAAVPTATGHARTQARPKRPKAKPKKKRAQPRPAQTTPLVQDLGDGYVATSTIVGNGPWTTGLPVTVQTTITSTSGAPDPSARAGSYQVTQRPPNTAKDVLISGTDGPDDQGDLGSNFTALDPGAYQLTLEVYPQPGMQPVAVTLPTVTFAGANAQLGPLTPAQLDAALGATALVAAAPAHPASIGVYGEAPPPTSDLGLFEKQYNLAPLQLTQRKVDGGATGNDAGWSGELALDLESVAMTAPGASVTVYELPLSLNSGDPSLDALNAVAADDTVRVFSLSAAETESSFEPDQTNLVTEMQTAAEAANAEGITIVAASGDGGAFADGGQQPVQTVSVPADLPQVTSVGGVDMRINATGGGGLATSGWGADEFGAMDANFVDHLLVSQSDVGNIMSAGGFSNLFSAPSYQSGVLPAGQTGRGVPDLAMPADPNFPGISMVFGGQASTSGGTSLAAPLLAGYLADIAAQSGGGLGNVNPTLYKAAASTPGLMTQALYGYNGVAFLQAGAWNDMTGLGTPNIGLLQQALTGQRTAVATTPAHLTVAAAPSVVAGHALRLAVQATTAYGAPASAVVLSVSASGPRTLGLSATAKGGSVGIGLRLVKAGTYLVTVSVRGDAAVGAHVTVHVLPGPATRFAYLGRSLADSYRRGYVFREGLEALDAYGNVDTLVTGKVTWTFKVGGKTYRSQGTFVHGVAYGSFVVPRTATGPIQTTAAPTYRQS